MCLYGFCFSFLSIVFNKKKDTLLSVDALVSHTRTHVGLWKSLFTHSHVTSVIVCCVVAVAAALCCVGLPKALDDGDALCRRPHPVQQGANPRAIRVSVPHFRESRTLFVCLCILLLLVLLANTKKRKSRNRCIDILNCLLD